MFDRVLNTPPYDTSHRDLTDRANVCYCENQVFLYFYEQFEIKAKLKQFCTLVLIHSLKTILDTKLKRFHGGIFELEILEIVTRAFLLKIIIRT